jgi:hypothetical protein
MPDRLRKLLPDLDGELATREEHSGSPFVGQAASREYQEHIARGGTSKSWRRKSADDDLHDVKDARVVQPRAGGAARVREGPATRSRAR